MILEELINNRNLARINILSNNTMSVSARYRTSCQYLRKSFRQLKNKWWLTKEAEIQTLVYSNDLKLFFLPKHESWVGAKRESPRKLQTLDSKIIIAEKHEVLAKCKDTFAKLLYKPSTVKKHEVANVEKISTQAWTCKCPHRDEVG